MRKAISVKVIEKAIKTYKGNVTLAAASIGMNRTWLHTRIARSAKLRAALAEARETRLDMVEDAHFQSAYDGNVHAQKNILNSQGKERGWGETQEITIVTRKGFIEVSPDDWDS